MNQLKCPAKHINGFTLVELVVTIAIGTMLATLILSSIAHTRESARLITCMNNVRQQGLAMISAEQTNRIVPHNGGANRFDANGKAIGSQIIARDGTSVSVSITYNPNIFFPLGVGEPAVAAQLQPGPWCYAILPYMDAAVEFQQRAFQKSQPSFICPTRNRKQIAIPVNDNLFSCEAGGWAWAKTDYAATFNIGYRTVGQPLAKFAPYGLDQIILIGEKAMDPFLQPVTSWYHDEPLFTGGTSSTARTGRSQLSQNGIHAAYREGFGSAHSGGVNFVYFSGRTQTISFNINMQVWDEINPAITFDANPVEPALD